MTAEPTIKITMADGTSTREVPMSVMKKALNQVKGRKAKRPAPPQEFVNAADEMARKGRAPMADDPDFRKHNQDAYAVTADELRQFIERFEQLESEKADIATQQKELMGEAKGRGYDTKVMRKVIALRRRKPDELAEEEAVLDLYKSSLGMA